MTDSKQATRRLERAVTLDPRAAATRQKIVEALEELLEQGTFPSVAGLCDQAGIGRSTFYVHFSAVDDVFVFVMDGIIDEISRRDRERRRGSSSPRSALTIQAVTELLEALESKRDFLLGRPSTSAEERLHEHLSAQVASNLDNVIRDEQPDLPSNTLRTISDFIAGGILHAMLGWLAQPAGRDKREFTSAILPLLPTWLAGDLAPDSEIHPPDGVHAGGPPQA
ncbi:TetR/AcrR family transcriptional regulator [Leucobacter rhizosphaerae]|uniref:TetR/AcrR family transcriptional regulator n=1 Tax=Leucobacter rhizosphaerae TaxID=2932245 RepID=A0ABY4FTX9_9MICO|nr:TetR/AcrR family transcriptional regulator [Leucobacter rhizosphaerae]UOQ59712.1 TetR/AcrR family transcriptional regulator [Leucobacter rhizosphaerae]